MIDDFFRKLITEEFNILDLGAVDDGEKPKYSAVTKVYKSNIYAFDEFECQSISDKENYIYTDKIIADGEEKVFYETSNKTTSSIYEPNIEECKKFHNYSKYLNIKSTYKVKTFKLDDLMNEVHFDFIKMDIQGGEWVAINNGEKAVKTSPIIELETRFFKQYKNQPLFSEVDQLLNKHGFYLYCFLGYGSMTRKPIKSSVENINNQWLWSDSLYLKCDKDIETMRTQQLIKAACIMHKVYGVYDYACYCLSIVDKSYGTKYAEEYENILLHEV